MTAEETRMTRPVKISFLSMAGVKIRKPIGKMTKPIKIAFLGKSPPKRRDNDTTN